jgi:hypothetical protein
MREEKPAGRGPRRARAIPAKTVVIAMPRAVGLRIEKDLGVQHVVGNGAVNIGAVRS